MEEKISFLMEYNKNVRILTSDEISKLNDHVIPAEWKISLSHDDIRMKIDTFMNIWKEHKIELRNTISYLYEHLINIELMEIESTYSILYTIKNSKGNILYYEGRNPKEGQKSLELEDFWDKTPTAIKNFYENIHDGFYYYASESMGLAPLESVAFLGDEDWDWSIIDDLEEPLKINLDSSFGFFTNGMGSYIAIDYNNCMENNATFWSAKIKPKYNINFWSYVDEWIVIGFES